ncbi:MAG: hypothetical protein ACT4P6_16660 [Gemmatimonadaceae bacterium]
MADVSAARQEEGQRAGSVDRAARTVAALRFGLLVILMVACAGMVAELFLLEHTDDTWQWVPIILLGVSLPVMLWQLVRPSRASARTLQLLMLLFVASGLVGLGLHYKGNVEFEREMYPTLTGLQLFKQAMTGATPSLAPGTMVQFGLLGLLYTFRHPDLRRSEA